MSPRVALAFFWGFGALLIGAYVWFMVWRLRVDRRKREARAAQDDEQRAKIAALVEQRQPTGAAPDAATPAAAPSAAPSSSVPSSEASSSAAVPAAPSPRLSSAPSPASPSANPPASAPPLASPERAGEPPTVAGALAGISLPAGLVPLTTLAPRVGTGDRVAFWTNEGRAEAVGPQFADELERLGFTVRPLDESTLGASRESTHLVVVVHADPEHAVIDGARAFPSIPEQATVIEVWVAP